MSTTPKLKNRLDFKPPQPAPSSNGHRNGSNGTALAPARNGSNGTALAPARNGSNGTALAPARNGSNGSALAPARNGAHAPAVARPWTNPTQLDRPSFLMNFPFSYATGAPNNPWMRDLKGNARDPNFKRAAVQFLDLYRSLSAEGLVYLLPTPRNADLQDLVYSANLGIVLEHLPDRNTVVISNFTSPPRMGETIVGVRFFEDLGYNVLVAPGKFEGEAELKHLHGNVYVGGYGIRSERETYDWMERRFDMRIIKVRETEEYLYHLDCSLFPITKEDTVVCTELFTKKELAEIGKFTNVIPVTAEEAFSGICNSVRLPNQVLNSSHLHDLKAGTKEYRDELGKNRRLEDIAANLALEVSYVNLSEYHKSGALLSCMVMHLNRHSYKIALTA